MLQTLLKAVIFAAIVKYLRLRLKWLIFSIGGIFLTLIGHAEYMSYVELTKDYVGVPQSYWYKYLAIAIFILVYLFGEIRQRGGPNSTCEEMPPLPERLRPKEHGDGFDFLRKKERLMTHGERFLEESKAAERSR